jgi:hypothetical protein
MEEVIKEVFGEAYSLESLQQDGFILIYKASEIRSAIYVGWTNSFQSVKLDAVIGLMRFDNVENLIGPILRKFKISYTSYGNWPATLNWFVRIRGQEIKRDDVQNLRGELINIMDHVKNIEDNFFKRITSVAKASEYLSALTEEQLSEKVANPVLIRKFVVDCLAGAVQNPEENRDKIIREYIEAEKLYPKIFKNHDKAVAEIFETIICK